jgi:hypothetical protein
VGCSLAATKNDAVEATKMTNNQAQVRASQQAERDSQATRAAEAAAENVTLLRERTTENVRQATQAGTAAAATGFQEAASRFQSALGFSGEEGKRLSERSTLNMEAVTRCGAVLAEAAQDVSREWFGLAQRQMKRNLDAFSVLAKCRSVQDLATVQSDLLREGLQQMIEDGRRIAERSSRAVEEASSAFTDKRAA